MICQVCDKQERKAKLRLPHNTYLCDTCMNRQGIQRDGTSYENIMIERSRLRYERMVTRANNRKAFRRTPKKVMPECPVCRDNSNVSWSYSHQHYHCSHCAGVYHDAGVHYDGNFWYMKDRRVRHKKVPYVYMYIRDGLVLTLNHNCSFVIDTEELSSTSKIRRCEICQDNFILDIDTKDYWDVDGYHYRVSACADCINVIHEIIPKQYLNDDLPF